MSKARQRTFVVYRRQGNTVTPFTAWLRQSARGWKDGQPYGVTYSVVLGDPIAWSELYAGHTAWIADQLEKRSKAIKEERQRRAARKGLAQGVAASAGAVLSKPAL